MIYTHHNPSPINPDDQPVKAPDIKPEQPVPLPPDSVPPQPVDPPPGLPPVTPPPGIPGTALKTALKAWRPSVSVGCIAS